MDAERWQRVQELVERALGQPPDARAAFLARACDDDPALRAEALSLLDACERSPEEPAPPSAWLQPLAAAPSPRLAENATLANRYRLQSLLARGGMGEVYEAWDEVLSIPVALKTLHLAAGSDDAYRRLKLEGLLARAVWHPNVCRHYALERHRGPDGDLWFLTMELLRGETLTARLRADGRLRGARALAVATQVARGLGAAHQAGVVHRDLKPGNVMLVDADGERQAVVMDFGIALADGAASDPLAIVGTPAYMAPEQLRGEAVGPAADLYALGLVLYELVTGALPLPGDGSRAAAERRLREDPPSPRQLVPDLDERWESAILGCLQRDPERRFASAEAVVAALTGSEAWAGAVGLERGRAVESALPAERDRFVGRAAECEQLRRALDGGARVATLLGAAGLGKTRLAIHFAREHAGGWPGGVVFCDFTEARSLDGVASAVAGALGVQLARGDAIAQLGHALAGRGRALMVLDNLEQIVDLVPATLGRWLDMAPEARFVATSRERLRLGDLEAAIELAPLEAEAGAALFADRARRLRPGLELDGQAAAAVGEIVRLADGLPLAIELASARVGVMDVPQIARQMRQRFSLLSGGSGSRHETLMAAIDASWELLKPWERSAWAQCAVFEGGFALDAAEHVIALDAHADAPWVVDVLGALVDKSLLRASAPLARATAGSPAPRFSLLPTLHEFARLRLDGASTDGERMPDAADVQVRHGAWYARFGERDAIALLRRRGTAAARHAVEPELENIAAACRRAIDRDDAPTAVANLRALWAVLALRGPFGEALALGRLALDRLHASAADALQVLRVLGQAAWYAGLPDEAGAHQQSLLAGAREQGDEALAAQALLDLAGFRVSRGQMEEGEAILQQALAAIAASGDHASEGQALSLLGVIHRGQGRMDAAREQLERALAAARGAGDRRLEGSVLVNLGLVLQDLGDSDGARRHYEEGLAAHREVGHRRFEGNAHDNLGALCLDQGHLVDARRHMEQALAIHRETGARFSEGITRINLGSLCHAEARPADARAQLDAALRIQREVGNRRMEGHVLGALGRLEQEFGLPQAARARYDAALVIHREQDDGRSEGYILTHLASLLNADATRDEARACLERAEPLLRQAEATLDLGLLLCVKAELAQGDGDPSLARTAITEAQTLAERLGAEPGSEFGRMLARARKALASGSQKE